ncbi:hypothetical protein ACFPM7_13230 [Actinokineospora guangxiensis]|uniref:Uncharacterized protein n=1 Tax=Actinokineospora guangxiensis TaxID=1490288 RepID=A0ABW0EKN6_9PSEU
MVQWITDAQLFDAEASVGSKVQEAMQVLTEMDIALPPTEMTGMTECLTPSPESVLVECERLHRLYLMTIDDVPVDIELRAAENQLQSWQGSAAAEFKNRLTAIGSVHEQQKLLLGKATLHAGALLSLIKGIRQSYLDVALETVAALDAEIGNTDKRQAKTFIAIGSDLVRDVLTMDFSRLLTGSIAVMIGVAKNLADYLIEGSRYEEIIERYHTGCGQINEQYRSGLAHLANEISMDFENVTSMATRLDDPLPPNVDIHSPNFEYRHFAHESMPVSEYDPQVEREKERMADAQRDQQSAIDRRLVGDR